MRSDADFYLAEYEKCQELYKKCPSQLRRHKRLYRYIGASMLKAYIEARKEAK